MHISTYYITFNINAYSYRIYIFSPSQLLLQFLIFDEMQNLKYNSNTISLFSPPKLNKMCIYPDVVVESMD